jgi:hypothetical protein
LKKISTAYILEGGFNLKVFVQQDGWILLEVVSFYQIQRAIGTTATPVNGVRTFDSRHWWH